MAKVHHAAMDGGKVVALLLGCLFDLSPEGTEIPPPDEEWRPEPWPSRAWFAADTARSLATKPLHALRALTDVAGALRERLTGDRDRAEGAARLFEAPATAFTGALTPHRSIGLADASFADVRAIKRHFGTTVNDVVLAASAGALRTWLLDHGGLPDRPLVVNVPVAVRGSGEDDAGNRVSMILVHLPVQEPDPAERLRAIHAETRRAKETHGRAGGDVFEHVADVLTHVTVPWVLTHVMELYSSTHAADRLPVLWNLVISNLPGPPVTLYCAGAEVRRVYPLGPVQQGSGLNLTVLSVGDRLCLGAMACQEMVPDPDRIAAAFVDEVRRLRERCSGSA